MSRLLSSLFIIAICASLLAAIPANAKDFRDKYQDVTLPQITDFMVRSKVLPLATHEQLMDYLAVTECDIHKMVKDSQFKQQEIQAAIQKKITQPIPGDGFLYVKVPTIFYISEYNFDTQALTLAPESQMQRANTLDLISTTPPVCSDVQTAKISLPALYNIRLNIPISFHRIPLRKEIAETIYSKMDRVAYGKNYVVVYGMMYLQIEPVPPILDAYYSTNRATVRGQLNVIDLYLDPDHKVLLRELDFDENY